MSSEPGVAAVAAGGTGGHIFPALAVAHALERRGWTVVWLGNSSGLEAKIAAQNGIALCDVAFGQVRGKGWRRWFALPAALIAATGRAVRGLRAHRVSVVATFGGYVSVPAALAAKRLRLPLVIHEQNARAGLANRVLAPLADRVLAAFPNGLRRAQVVGNPVRETIVAQGEPQLRYRCREGPLRLLVLGGSLGAQRLNRLVPLALRLLAPSQRPMVRHQTGECDYEATVAAYREAGVAAQCEPFIVEMGSALAASDWVLCRAGAMTVSEVAAVGVAAHFVPYPYAVDDHQYANAQWLVARDAALVTREADLTPERLAEWLRTASRADAARIAERAYALGIRDAQVRIAEVIEEMTHR
ncbi:undecaprenyldiphospho-muramoylpentapeptide beta-N-acetylglucosaminyltransferase [Hydrogenophilus thiooxidans]|uniref:undecaprenyldiphospho-muramoylpentapeptide beta-N-acetylglucosaminyltransferase n=1 Tax=Hydrogenophilus thiooxidans TaxID=2820326 RepID=UPI001C22D26C|nr:undecaprenyldiphospho-muramoylpentapeptide beta-N-acetylglucosaminyltransferase [Hydrogenophilus thiooxidans]